jgi:energy-coupling factor transport system ATP-binding protein
MSIEFSNFTFKYWALEKATLKNINLKIEQGEKVVIIGASGSGKSTLGQCLNGLIPFAIKGDITGDLLLDGKNSKDMSLDECTNKVGTVLQDTDGQFVGLTVAEDIAFALENQMMAKDPMHKIVNETAAMVDLDDMLDVSPFDLSGGQKQRVSLAGVMVNDVNTLLFDEPLASLDPQTGKMTIEIIDRLHKETGKTVIIIEHRLEDVLHRPVDRIILMDKGEIVANGTPDELLASPLLQQYGIREPLYLSALKAAGCEITEADKPAYIDTIDIEKFKPQLLSWFAEQATPTEKSQGDVLLSLKKISYSYDGIRPTVNDISFNIHKGEFVSLLGKNGSGKSTLTRLIMGVIEEDEGEMYFNGDDLSQWSIFNRCQKIGVVLQNPNHMISHHMIFDEIASILRNRGMDEEKIQEKVFAILELCGLGKYRHWPIDALSYGQKKRVTIASILVQEPELLILDEPTSGQDFHHYTQLMEFVCELNKKLGITILIISHDMHLVLEYTQRAVVISDSKLLADESVGKVFSQPTLLNAANLAVTSLYTLAEKVGITDIEQFIRCFIEHEASKKQ